MMRSIPLEDFGFSFLLKKTLISYFPVRFCVTKTTVTDILSRLVISSLQHVKAGPSAAGENIANPSHSVIVDNFCQLLDQISKLWAIIYAESKIELCWNWNRMTCSTHYKFFLPSLITYLQVLHIVCLIRLDNIANPTENREQKRYMLVRCPKKAFVVQ